VKGRASGVVRLLPLRRPFPPRLVELVPQDLETGEPRQQGPALGAKLRESRMMFGFGTGLEGIKRRPQRTPFQFADGDVIDDIASSQPGERAAGLGQNAGLKSRKLFDVDIKRIEKQPAVRRIGAAIGRPVVEQRMQRIEADTVGPQMACQFDQPFEVGKIANPPVARRPDAVELYRQQPAAVEIAAEGLGRGDDQRRILGERGSIGQMQQVGTLRQIRRPGDDAIAGLALRDNPKTGNDFPAQRKRGSLAEFGLRGLSGPDHHRLPEKAVRHPDRQGIEDDF
jgi:hypothetical protein